VSKSKGGAKGSTYSGSKSKGVGSTLPVREKVEELGSGVILGLALNII
jgi:hypothetical protein